MAVTKNRVAHPLGRLTLPQKGVVFSGKRFTDSSVNLLFGKMRPRTPPFHGVLVAESDAKRYFLVIVDNEPYAAGVEEHGVFLPLTLRDLFGGLRQCSPDSAELTLVGTDPIYLKTILTLMQAVPTTEGSSELLEIGSVVGHIKKNSSDQLLVVGHRGELSLFYFRGGNLLAGYCDDPDFETGEDSLEERLLGYVYNRSKSTPVSLHVFAEMSAVPAGDGTFARGEWPDELVEHFTRPIPALLVLGTDGARRFELTSREMTFGRAEDNDIIVDDPAISRKHLVFRSDGACVTVEDCGSRNGTLLEGAPLKKASLVHGMEMQIGDCLIRFLQQNASGTDGSSDSERGEETICHAIPETKPNVVPPPEDLPEPVRYNWGLQIERGDGTTNRVVLEKPLTTIGRSKADVTLAETKVSRRHGELEVGADGVRYRDTGSTNGSLLNGKAVTDAALDVGDVLKIGETSITVFREAA